MAVVIKLNVDKWKLNKNLNVEQYGSYRKTCVLIASMDTCSNSLEVEYIFKANTALATAVTLIKDLC